MPSSLSLRRALLAACLSLPLISCGGGGGGDAGTPAPAPAVPVAVTVSAAAGPTEGRLRCFAGVPDDACQLRFYQVMVEAFADGEPVGHGTGYGTSPHTGDLQGITNALDHIQGTGANALWLTPVFASTPIAGQDDWTDRLDATGYFASDYFRVDPKFGTDAQLRALVNAAHARGMRVVLDGVFGHHKRNLAASPTGKRPQEGPCRAADGSTYAAAAHQACTDWSDPATHAFFQEVVTHWITRYGIDGWRLDQAYQVPVGAWASLRQSVADASASVSFAWRGGATTQPLGHLVAEVWSDEATIQARAYGTDAAPALGSAFDFPGRYRLVQTLAGEEAVATSRKAGLPATTLAEAYATYARYPAHAMPNLMLTNHDLVRFGDLLQRAGIAQPDQDAYWLRHKAAFAFLAAHSGPVTLYYGDEVGQEVPGFAAQVTNDCALAGLCDDHVSRTAGKLAGFTARENDLRQHVATLMALRDANPALAVGRRTHIHADRTIYIDRKDAGANRVLFVLNTGTTAATVTLGPAVLGAGTLLADLLDAGATVPPGPDGHVIAVPALSARFLTF